MSGSNDYVIKLGADGSELLIAGQLEGTMSKNGSAVEVTNKANGGKVTYLDGFVAGDQVSFAGTFTLTAETVQNTIKAAIESGTQIPGVVQTGVGGEKWQCDTWLVTGRSDSAAVNGVSVMSVTFNSSGAFTHTPAS
jgi:phage tail sheath gpL-like